MAYRSGKHDKSTRRMNGCGSKGAQRRARRYACGHGTRKSWEARKAEKGAA